MADQRGSSNAKLVGPVVAIGVVAYVALFMTGHTTIALPLFWGLVIFGIVYGVRKNRAQIRSRQANRTATFPTSPLSAPPASAPPVSSAPGPAGQTFPSPPPASPAPTPAPAPMPAPAPPPVVPPLTAGSEATEPSPEVVAHVLELKNSGRTVDAIEALREATGMELYEASQYIRKL